ncbi:uncharacterized protein LOC127702053 [Mytilus californianus]|uniref:uncharacterized protein LOC127702053 n=1 Tax=Mytilus californianus TaxID=6549 RepID=UPI0022450E63|nr:uncharacterized protein LOC127702053 [Mytilus californianus]
MKLQRTKLLVIFLVVIVLDEAYSAPTTPPTTKANTTTKNATNKIKIENKQMIKTNRKKSVESKKTQNPSTTTGQTKIGIESKNSKSDISSKASKLETQSSFTSNLPEMKSNNIVNASTTTKVIGNSELKQERQNNVKEIKKQTKKISDTKSVQVTTAIDSSKSKHSTTKDNADQKKTVSTNTVKTIIKADNKSNDAKTMQKENNINVLKPEQTSQNVNRPNLKESKTTDVTNVKKNKVSPKDKTTKDIESKKGLVGTTSNPSAKDASKAIPETKIKSNDPERETAKKNEQKEDNVKNERKSTVRRNVLTTSTTTQATATDTMETATTWDGLPCSSRFQAHPLDKTKFETAFNENVFENIYQSCPVPLVWRQDQCRCGWAEPELVESCKCCSQGLKAHTNPQMYQRLVNGQWQEETCSTYTDSQVWNDDNCTCVWNPNKPQSHKAPVFRGAILPKLMTKCVNLVNMTLDEGLRDADGRDLTPLFGRQRIRVVEEKGDIGKSVEIRRAPFKLGIFNGNDLQSTVYFKFNFKVHPDQVRRRQKMIIMSNGCKRRWQRKVIKPSLEVAFYPFNETFEVQFSTSGKTVVEFMKGVKDASGWYQCVLYLQDRVLNLKVNGKKVYSTNGMSGRVKSTDCPLTVAGSPTNPQEHFDGYLDELQIVKQCKYEQDSAS